MRFGSVCSGIEAASVAWEPLGWKAAWVSEIEPFPSAVLTHHYPEVPNLGDMTTLPDRILSGEVEAPDLFCGGTPCQAFSVAGLRRSLDDARGNLSLTFCEIANAIDFRRSITGLAPAVIFWENVPGVLSTKDNAFGCFLAGLAGEDVPLEQPGGKWTDAGVVLGPARTVAWRILDAQYFGLAQRRRRVFVVASARAGFDPAAVLLEWEGVRRDSAPSREAGKGVANSLVERPDRGGGNSEGQRLIAQPYAVGNTLTARMHKGINTTLDEGQTPVLAHSLRGEGFDASEDGTGRGTPLVPVPMINMQGSKGNAVAQSDGPSFTLNAMHGHDMHAVAVPVAVAVRTANTSANGHGISAELAHTLDQAQGQAVIAPTLTASNDPSRSPQSSEITAQVAAVVQATAVAFDAYNHAMTGDISKTLDAGQDHHHVPNLLQAMQVRRLTPVECERLQGFPDGYTAIPWRNKPASECPDGPRYKALGNSWAVPVVRWIGARIARALSPHP